MSILAPGFCFAYSHSSNSAHALALHLAAAATNPAEDAAYFPAWAVVLLAAASILALLLAVATGVFRPSRVDGPLRVAPAKSLWPLAATIGIAIVMWYGSQVFYFAVKQVAHPHPAGVTSVQSPASGHPGPDGKIEKPSPQLTVLDFAVLSTGPGLLAFVFLYAADQQLSAALQLRLGFTRGRFFDGIAKGILASVMVMPAMYLAMIGLELIYIRTGYQHPGEHALLRVMHEAKSPVLRGFLIGGAVLTAPFFEEYLFRGFLQTFLRQLFINLSTMWTPGPTLPMSVVPIAADGMPAAAGIPLPPPGDSALPYFRPAAQTGPPPAGGRVWQSWAAILVTSILFASIHETWTAPLIFTLAVFLGYAYERTGSLWTTITIHMVFNASSTIIFLMQRS